MLPNNSLNEENFVGPPILAGATSVSVTRRASIVGFSPDQMFIGVFSKQITSFYLLERLN